MKITNVLFLSVLLSFFTYLPNYAQEQGIMFFEGTWSEALRTAKEENKLIFVDVYTDWCPPCKKMDKEVLPLSEVGDRYNEVFINFKLDAEKGEGPELAERYAVHAYPTYLYLDAEGNPLHRAVGYFDPSAFLAHVDQVTKFANDDYTLAKFDSAFEKGERDRDFLRNYIEKKKELGVNNGDVMNIYFSQLTWRELNSPEELEFLGLMTNSVNNNALTFLLQNFDVIDEISQRELAPNLFSLLVEASGNSIMADSPLASQQALDFAEQLLPYLNEKHHKRFYLYSLLHQKTVRDTAGVKRNGKVLVGDLMEIPLDTIRTEDARRFEELMAPFVNGEQDSTQIEGFQEEKEFARNTYSREVGTYLFEAAKTYSEALADDDPALRDALQWVKRSDELVPHTEKIEELLSTISARVRED